MIEQQSALRDENDELRGEVEARDVTVHGFEEILSGKCDDMPEGALLFVGTIDEAREKAQSL